MDIYYITTDLSRGTASYTARQRLLLKQYERILEASMDKNKKRKDHKELITG